MSTDSDTCPICDTLMSIVWIKGHKRSGTPACPIHGWPADSDVKAEGGGLLDALEFSAKWLEDHEPWSFNADANLEIAKQTVARVALLRELRARLEAWRAARDEAEAVTFENISANAMASADRALVDWLTEHLR